MTLEPPPPGHTRLVGMRSSAGPLRDVVIRLGTGVTALYGRNGAGKSWILRALGDALRGYRSQNTHLIVEDSPDTAWRTWIGDVLDERSISRPDWDEEQEESGLTLRSSYLTSAIREWYSTGGRYLRPPQTNGSASDAFIGELVQSPHFALVPTGISEPRWDVWVCIDPNDETNPEVTGALRRLERVASALDPLMMTLGGVRNHWHYHLGGGKTCDCGSTHSTTWAHDVLKLAHQQSQDLLEAISDRPFRSETLKMITRIEAACNALPGSSDESGGTEVAEALLDWAVKDGGLFLRQAPLNWLSEHSAGWLWDREDIWDGTVLEWKTESFLLPILRDGLPVPIARIAEVRSIPWVVHDESTPADIDRLTSLRFAEAIWGEQRSSTTGRAVEITPSMEEWVVNVTTDANAIYTRLLQDAPMLKLTLASPHEWTVSSPLAWTIAAVLPSFDPWEETDEHSFSVSALSTAEKRWAKVAIRTALDRARVPRWARWPVERYESADLVMLDEPEAALHRSAERHMALGLDSLSFDGPQVVVATHSPEVLNRPEATLVHVHREGGGATTTSQLDRVDLEASVTQLGMLPSDLIGMYRIFLLVEGEHDEIVVRGLLGDVLESARVKIIPIRGGSKLPSTVESQVLFDMTTAYVIALLDNVDAREVEEVWHEAQERYLTGDADQAITFLTSRFRDRKGDEYQWISSWLARALKKGVNERLVPYGLVARDVIEYLPVEVIAPKAGKSWEELRAEHDAAKPTLDRSKGLHDFKVWLKRTYEGDTSPENVRRAAEAVTTIPEDLKKLGYRIREISTRRP